MNWLAERLEPTPSAVIEPVLQDTAVDGLRGLCALTVLYCHVTATAPMLDPVWIPPSTLWWIETGQGAVLIFFILSGYVIGLTNRNSFSRINTLRYLARRAVRIIPINVIGVALAVVAGTVFSIKPVIGNLFFLQHAMPADGWWKFALLPTNANLWSLHYEVLYYLLFLLIWLARPSLLFLGTIAGSLSLSMYWLPGPAQVFSTYACGLLFWTGGLWIAWRWPAAVGESASASNWPSAVLLAIATWQMQFFAAVLHRIGRETPWGPWVMGTYLDFLPVALWIVASVTRRHSRYLPALRLFAAIWPFANFLWRIVRGTMIWSGRDLFLLTITIAALLLWRWRPSFEFFRRFASLGLIAYAVYATGAPIQHLVLISAPGFAGTPITYLVRLLICAGLVLATGWLLEQRFQPILRRRLLKSSSKS